MMNRYRTREETVELFRKYQREYEKDAREAEKDGHIEAMKFYLGKAEAYETAAFEIEHNMER